MAKQDGWRPLEEQSEPSLLVLPGAGAYTTEDCRTLWNYLDQLVKEGMLQQFLYRPDRQGGQARVMFVTRLPAENSNSELKRARLEVRPSLSFLVEDKIGTIQPYDDALVVTLRIGGYDVKRVMVDQDSYAEIMYPDLYRGLNLKPENLTAYNSPLVSFDGKVVIPKGQIRLPVQAGSEVVEADFIVVDADFIVVDAYSPYTTIVARPWLHTLEAVSSTLHQKVKYPSGNWIEKLLKSLVLPVDKLAEDAKCEDLEKFAVEDDPEKFFQVGAQLPPQEKEELVKFLKRNIDVFDWNAYEALGVDPSFICHHLNVNLSAIPRKQPPRHSSKDHSNVVKDEVMKLKRAQAIKEVFYPKWLANTVVVRKKNGKGRLCVDFTDLNKACPKDPFSMPRIDQLVDATVGYPRMSFLDAFQGYH
nr:uncharacterized protein LOC111983703 [Quercus suber]